MIEMGAPNIAAKKPCEIARICGIYSFDVGARARCPLGGVEAEEESPQAVESEEAQLPKITKAICGLTAKGIAVRARGRTPFRDWCKWCQLGRGKEDAREKTDPEETSPMPVTSVDYCFVNTKLETEMVSILVMVQKREDAEASIAVMQQGPSECVNLAVEFFLEAWGAADFC
eukprot:6805960-Pyramimonas_sp.AAC.1